MNDTFQKFREVNAAGIAQNQAVQALLDLGKSLETCIIQGVDTIPLRHPEILNQILALHLSLTYERNPSLEPPKEEPTPVEENQDQPKVDEQEKEN